ncbi:uncharacterized protein TrAFT101_002669 [Trichoderma asperellum]|uniref:uncharacterized protein n=1 Tax=Trichoderma asperellum TaxID=101201 RepID=UPI0033295BC8|nr:hypothetical protein TrAFT101_002669 [Trichoderma asperellum]
MTYLVMALSVKCRRKALASYTSQDGSSINRGDWVCIPRRALMQDGTRYKEPPYAYLAALDSLRANAQLQQLKPCAEMPDQEESGLTHVSHNWPIRSFGNMSWQVHAIK